MKIGIPKEILNSENRVALTPSGVFSLTNAGHEVSVETNAGVGAGFLDNAYKEVGAKIVQTNKEAWNNEMIMKVKEPQKEEFEFMHEGQILFTYLHLASHPELTEILMKKKTTAIAYETVQLQDNSLPLLMPMSEVAGYMSTQIGAQYLEKINGGQGVLLGGITGVKPGHVVIIGGGVVGTNAAKQAIGLGANVTIFDLNPVRLKQLTEMFANNANVLMSNPMEIGEAIKDADLAIGSVLIPGAKAPVLVSDEMVRSMKPGAVIVDVAIDQGGNFETSDRIMTHDNPVYEKHEVLHYTVTNIPGAVPQTATKGLTNATVPYALQLANKDIKTALTNPALKKGVNTFGGHVTNKGVAEALNLSFKDLSEII